MGLLKENLLVQFSIAGLVIITVIASVLAAVLSSKIRSDAINEVINEAVGHASGRLLRELTPEDLELPMTGERRERFHEFVEQSIVSKRTARITLWAGDATVI